jgi:hypothetical protein
MRPAPIMPSIRLKAPVGDYSNNNAGQSCNGHEVPKLVWINSGLA